VIPDGSVVRGRIRRLERYQGGGAFIVGLEFTEVEVRGRLLPFYADPLAYIRIGVAGVLVGLLQRFLLDLHYPVRRLW